MKTSVRHSVTYITESNFLRLLAFDSDRQNSYAKLLCKTLDL